MAQYKVKMRVILETEVNVRSAKNEGDAEAQAANLAIRELRLVRNSQVRREQLFVEFASRGVEKTEATSIEKVEHVL